MSEEGFVDAGVLSRSPQDLASRLDNMMNTIMALSQRVNAQDGGGAHHHEEAPRTSHARPKVKRRKARLVCSGLPHRSRGQTEVGEESEANSPSSTVHI